MFLGFPFGSAGKESAAMWETGVQSLGWEDTLKKGKATHSSILALENSMDYIDHRVTKSQTRLSDFHFHIVDSVYKVDVSQVVQW